MKRRLLTLLITAIVAAGCLTATAANKYVDRLPHSSRRPEQFSREELMQRMNDTGLHHIEGVWRFTADGTEIAIMRPNGEGDGVDYYEIILLHASNRALRPGTVIGVANPAAKKGYYEARLYTRSTGSLLFAPKKFNLESEDHDTRIIFEAKKSAFSVNLWRLLPYMWRYSVHKNQDSKSVAGCVRIYPAPLPPLEPIYL